VDGDNIVATILRGARARRMTTPCLPARRCYAQRADSKHAIRAAPLYRRRAAAAICYLFNDAGTARQHRRSETLYA